MKRAICVLLVLAAVPCGARTITVDDDGPADFNNVQAGIDDANDGDTVEIQPGTYTGPGNRDIDFLGKAITVAGTDPNDPNVVAATIIDCNGTEADNHRGFYFHNGEQNSSVVDGLTITNGYTTDSYPGTIFCDQSSPTIANCMITRNSMDRRTGAMIYCSGSRQVSPVIINCTISNNAGPGIGSKGVGPTIRGCTISRNMGLGIWASGSWDLVIDDCTICDNNGSGIDFVRVDAMIRNCTITGNHVGWGGGGLRIGGHFGSVDVRNCTIAGNMAESGGGICAESAAVDLTVHNCILWGNVAEYPEYGDEMHLEGSSLGALVATVSSSDVEGGLDGVYVPWFTQLIWEDNNIEADPCFADPNNHDYHLRSQGGRWDPNAMNWIQDDVTSPCIDAGDPMSPIGHEPFGNGGRINMGAYGGTIEGSKSYFGKPPCETIVAGDINGDCTVDSKDFSLLGLQWMKDNGP